MSLPLGSGPADGLTSCSSADSHRAAPVSPITNKSQKALIAFSTAIREKTKEMNNLLSAMHEDEMVMNGRVLIAWNEDDFEADPLTWDEFCSVHSLNGDRLKYALEALMDLKTSSINPDDGCQRTLRQFTGRDNWVLAVAMLTSGDEKVVYLWFKCAMYLARHLDHPVPFCMQVVNVDEKHPENIQKHLTVGPWSKHKEPRSGRIWYFNDDEGNYFFADAPTPWKLYKTDDDQLWWWNERTQQCFYDERKVFPWSKYQEPNGGRIWWWNDETHQWFYASCAKSPARGMEADEGYLAWSQCASKASGVSQSAGSAQASGAAETMAAEPIINQKNRFDTRSMIPEKSFFLLQRWFDEAIKAPLIVHTLCQGPRCFCCGGDVKFEGWRMISDGESIFDECPNCGWDMECGYCECQVENFRHAVWFKFVCKPRSN